jgi:hypothetical protein
MIRNVYIYGQLNKKNNSYLIYYVGETVLLAKRQIGHLIHILGLNYGIWDIDGAENSDSKIL